MVLDPQQIPIREKLILTGLYISKYDLDGVRRLGFESFVEAFNVIGYALGEKPASIKNYRDEFDPLFSNKRKGWHKRPIRQYCLKVAEAYKDLDIQTFIALLKSFTGYSDNIWSEVESEPQKGDGESQFEKRLVTGLAAERYFESVRATLLEFKNCSIVNTTRLGCGYDFRLSPAVKEDFLAVEVKGLADRVGNVSLTPKEYDVASTLTNRFFLFVVKNFKVSPFHEIYQNPLATKLKFSRKERVTVHISWLANV
jgi:hypothetical protein